jgi:hypothetical protein
MLFHNSNNTRIVSYPFKQLLGFVLIRITGQTPYLVEIRLLRCRWCGLGYILLQSATVLYGVTIGFLSNEPLFWKAFISSTCCAVLPINITFDPSVNPASSRSVLSSPALESTTHQVSINKERRHRC